MGFLLVLLLCLSASPAQGESVTASLAVSSEAAAGLPSAEDLQAGIRRLFNLQFGSIVSLDFAGSEAAAARVGISAGPDRLTVSTDFTRAGVTRSLVSTLPRGSPASLLSTAAGDIAFLFFSARGLSSLPLSPPPSLTAALSTDTLAGLAGWNRDEMEPVALAGQGGEVTVCFPHRYLTLGPRFQVTASTIRDLDAQALGREPLQLSGAVPGTGDRLLLLSERSASIVQVDRRLGTRTVKSAPGLSALPARRAGPGVVVSLPGQAGAPGLLVYRLGEGAPGSTVGIAASYLSALDEDGEGNFWVWDAGERRIRVVTPEGREIFSIKPLVSASVMPLPQQLAVFQDGSFILAGSGEAWKFQGSGIPVWRLARIPGRPGESLPSSFDLCVDRQAGSVTILDEQSRRLLAFSGSPSADQSRLSGMLSRLDTRKPGDLRDASRQALSDGLALEALQLAGQAGGAAEAERAQARRELLSEKAAGYAALADALARGLLYERADAAYVRASAAVREWSAEAPSDTAAASLLANVLARRREVRAALLGSQSADLRVVSARIVQNPAAGCSAPVSLSVVVSNRGALPATEVRLHAAVPAAADAPSLAAVPSIAAGEEVQLDLPLGAGAAADAAAGPLPYGGLPAVTGYALATWQAGTGSASSAFSFAVEVPAAAAGPDPAAALACRAVPQDTLAAGLADYLLRGAADAPQPLADLAGILDSLGASRAVAAGTPQSSPAQPGPSAMRAALRGLSADESDWAVVTVSLASSLGMGAAVISVDRRVLAAVDTGVPFFTALGSLPALSRFQPQLAAISPGGTLWVPLSCAVAPAGRSAWAWGLAEGLRALRAAEAGSLHRAELAGASDAPNAPVPFPLVLPSVTARVSGPGLATAVGAALEGLP